MFSKPSDLLLKQAVQTKDPYPVKPAGYGSALSSLFTLDESLLKASSDARSLRLNL